MEFFENIRIKWPYVTHAVNRQSVRGLLPPVPENNPGSLLLARVAQVGRHRDLESTDGRRMTLFPGDVIVATLGNRYATDQYEGAAVCSGASGHVLGIGGVCGEVVSRNEKMAEPTCLDWIGRLADQGGEAINLRRFRINPGTAHGKSSLRTVLSVGASMNAGKTTTAAQLIRCLSGRGFRVGAAKVTGTACRRDVGVMEDAGAVRVLDFSHCGYVSTAGCSADELLEIAGDLRAALLEHDPDYLVYEVADGILQRESRILLNDPGFRETVAGVVYSAPDSLSCESGARILESSGYYVIAMSGIVANSSLGIAEVEAATGIPCVNGRMILAGELVERLDQFQAA